MLPVRIEQDSIRIGRHLRVSFQRTLRIPDDGRDYPLPPGLGRFPVFRVEDYADTVPEGWREEGGVFIPMYQAEALWLSFDQSWWRPVAVKVGLGETDAISGKRWSQDLHAKPQDYLVCPDQPWLDGINAGEGFIRQFVAAPLGDGVTVEEQVTETASGGLHLRAFEPRPGLFPEEAPPIELEVSDSDELADMACMSCEMGLAAGGRMRQEIYPDSHGIGTWDPSRWAQETVRIVNSLAFKQITGLEPPPSPITAKTWTELGLPWFELERPGAGDLDPAEELARVKSMAGLHGGAADETVEVPTGQVRRLG